MEVDIFDTSFSHCCYGYIHINNFQVNKKEPVFNYLLSQAVLESLLL